jgi:plasmid maintenance system antidote protein VapI
MKTHTKIDIGSLIFQKLKEKERSIAWLAKKTGCDDSNLGKMLKNKRYIYPDLLLKISIALDEDFFAHYSQKLKDAKKDGQIDREKRSN